MSQLLHIECSPRKDRSASLEVARSFISSYQAKYPSLTAKTLDLWNLSLPEFDGEIMQAKYAGLSGLALTAAQTKAWDEIKALAGFLHQADMIVMSVPLWNFSIPYKLKHFIDLVTQKDVLFDFDQSGLRGLLVDKKAVVVYARGMDFSAQSITPAQHYDFQKPYVEAWLQFVGVGEVHSIIVEKTLFGDEVDRDSRREATQRAEALAQALT